VSSYKPMSLEALRLSHVSRHWHGEVLRSPSFWTDISYYSRDDRDKTLALVRASLDRGGKLPMTIIIYEDELEEEEKEERHFESFLRLVLDHTERWKSFKIGYHIGERPNFVFRDLPSLFLDTFRSPSLEVLSLTFEDPDMYTGSAENLFWSVVFAESAVRFPNLCNVMLLDCLPSLIHLQQPKASNSMTSLHVYFGHTVCEVELDVLACFLRAHPALTSLKIALGRRTSTRQLGPGETTLAGLLSSQISWTSLSSRDQI